MYLYVLQWLFSLKGTYHMLSDKMKMLYFNSDDPIHIAKLDWIR